MSASHPDCFLFLGFVSWGLDPGGSEHGGVIGGCVIRGIGFSWLELFVTGGVWMWMWMWTWSLGPGWDDRHGDGGKV